MNDPIMAPAHYTVYPVQPIEITRYLGFCLGNATKYVLRAPYKGGVEDCDKAFRYINYEMSIPQTPMSALNHWKFQKGLEQLQEYLFYAQGDKLWDEIAETNLAYLETLNEYVSYQQDFKCLEAMRRIIADLRQILKLRDTTGQIYEGMTGLPVRGYANE